MWNKLSVELSCWNLEAVKLDSGCLFGWENEYHKLIKLGVNALTLDSLRIDSLDGLASGT